MPIVRKTGLRKYGGTRKRRRPASVATRAKWQKPTARNQRSQILGNARMIRRMRSLMPTPVWSDFQYRQKVLGIISNDGDPTFSQSAYPLVDFATWVPVLRVSSESLDAVATKILRMNINFRYNLKNSDWAQITLYIVTPRRDAANRDPVAVPLQAGQDFIGNSDLLNSRLNSSIWAVHWARNVTLTSSTFLGQPATVQGDTFAGNPMTTYKKGNVTIKPKFRIRAPIGTKWSDMQPQQLAYHSRYYLLAFISSNNTSAIAEGTQVEVDMDMLATTLNSA